jgi:predicted protein tyrosine phosphatase
MTWTPNFSWIQPDLAVGGSFPVERAAELAERHGLAAVIDMRTEQCDDAALLDACGLRFLHLPTEDMAGVSQSMLDQGVDFAREMTRQSRRLLIHCEHGIGRSATLALCCLVDRCFAPLDALRMAKDARALVSPSEAQYRAWRTWIERRGRNDAPSYHAFGMIAYRHLAQNA